MPASLLVEAERDPDKWWRFGRARGALAYALLARAGEDFAKALHDGPADGASEPDAALRPFTVAAWSRGQSAWLRLTALDAPTARALPAISDSLREDPCVRFGNTAFRVARCGEDASAPRVSYEDLVAAPRLSRAVFAFRSPTTFHLPTGQHLPLPSPDRMVRGWAAHWRRFAPEPCRHIADAAEEVCNAAAVARHKIETVMEPLRRPEEARREGRAVEYRVGFVGRVALELPRAERLPDAERAAFAALCRYAAWCGTGHGTPLGFGWTELEEDVSARNTPEREQ